MRAFYLSGTDLAKNPATYSKGQMALLRKPSVVILQLNSNLRKRSETFAGPFALMKRLGAQELNSSPNKDHSSPPDSLSVGG